MELTGTNHSIDLLILLMTLASSASVLYTLHINMTGIVLIHFINALSDGAAIIAEGITRDPIPNSNVKISCADGTASLGRGRVGRCRPFPARININIIIIINIWTKISLTLAQKL